MESAADAAYSKVSRICKAPRRGNFPGLHSPYPRQELRHLPPGNRRHVQADLELPAQQYVGQFLSTFKEFPPRQKAGSFALDQVLESLQSGTQGGNK